MNGLNPPIDVALRRLQRRDAQPCAELEQVLFPGDSPWPESAFADVVERPHEYWITARRGDILIGYAGIAKLGVRPPFEYEIHNVGVDPAHQGRGVGRLLVTALLGTATGCPVHLEVRTDNAPAIALYRQLGFVTVGLRERYYTASSADALTMCRQGAQTQDGIGVDDHHRHNQ